MIKKVPSENNNIFKFDDIKKIINIVKFINCDRILYSFILYEFIFIHLFIINQIFLDSNETFLILIQCALKRDSQTMRDSHALS